MAGWSKMADGSDLDCIKTLHKYRKPDFCFDLEPGLKRSVHVAEEDKLRCLFDQLMCFCLKEICGSDCFRHLPPMLGDGQSLDLFKLYLLVREKGGYEVVSRDGLWDSVAKESGLGSGVGSAVKLIYVKYLDTLDRCLQKSVQDKGSNASLLDCGTNLSSDLMGLETELRGAFLSEIAGYKNKDGEHSCLVLVKNELDITDVGKSCNGSVDDTVNGSNGEDNSLISDANVTMAEVSNRKRKRECHQKMLDWVVEVAKNPCNPQVGSLPDMLKWKCYGMEHLWKQVLLARESIFLERNADIKADQSMSYWMMKRKMDPSMYDDHTGSERPRYSERLHSAKESRPFSSKKSHAQVYSESSSGSPSDLEDLLDKESNSYSSDSVVGWSGDNYDHKRVAVGPFSQANVPEWTEETYVSDSRWLGSRVWPLESKEHNKHLIERDRIGKGRQESCGCQHPGSMECVRFHICEKRMRLKLELGMAFYRWKFDKMGQEVALSWTDEDEKRFHAIIRSNPPSLGKCFWDEMFKSFPNKSREDLVSYYFNVYLLLRRGYQNRSTPSEIDSDDEESQFTLLSNRFGHGADKSPGSIFRSPKKPHLNSRY